MNKVLLVGYMGAGKTIIGHLLSNKANIPVVDLDKIIEEKENLSIKLIFETKGELYFRKKEHQILTELINRKESLIIALGGGTPCYYNNHEMLQYDNVISIYLKASITTLVKRLKNETLIRPLLFEKTNEEIEEFIRKHLLERNFYYYQSKYIINTDGKTTDEIVTEIYTQILKPIA